MSISLHDLSSGFLKTPEARKNVADFYAGRISVRLSNGREYHAGAKLNGTQLVKGMLVAAAYSSTNQGCDLYEILGVSGTDQKYGEGGVKYNSVAEALRDNKASNLTQLQAVEDDVEKEKGYGHGFYLWVRDLDSRDQGPWFYLYRGRWARGSGAEPLSFLQVSPGNRSFGSNVSVKLQKNAGWFGATLLPVLFDEFGKKLPDKTKLLEWAKKTKQSPDIQQWVSRSTPVEIRETEKYLKTMSSRESRIQRKAWWLER